MKIEALRRLNRLNSVPVLGKEGQLGELQDAFFDLDGWVVRYLVMIARSNGREVLLSPLLVRELDAPGDRLLLPLFDEEVEAIPLMDLGKPVSRRQELAYNRYFCIPDYWVDGAAWGSDETPTELASRLRSEHSESLALLEDLRASSSAAGPGRQEEGEELVGSRLVRVRELYDFEARCGAVAVGRPRDLLFDIETLSIRYLVLELDPVTMHTGKKLLLPPQLVAGVDRAARQLVTRLPREALAEAPEYKPGEPVSHAYEKALMLHYDSPRIYHSPRIYDSREFPH